MRLPVGKNVMRRQGDGAQDGVGPAGYGPGGLRERGRGKQKQGGGVEPRIQMCERQHVRFSEDAGGKLAPRTPACADWTRWQIIKRIFVRMSH